MTCRILVADDSTPIQKVIRIAFSKYAVEILTAGSLAEAIKECERSRPELVIADASLPGVSAASDFTRVLGKSQGAAMIMLMGTYDAVRESDLRSAGLESILKKPFDAVELLEACERMIPGRLVTAQAGSQTNATREAPQSLPPPPKAGATIPSAPPIIPPPTFSTDHAPGIPSFLLDPNEAPVMPPALPVIDSARKGLPAFEHPMAPLFAPRPSEPSVVAPPSSASVMDAAEELIRRELPGLVERAVQRYCTENFKGIAKDILTAELRRLADEKARYLVDQ